MAYFNNLIVGGTTKFLQDVKIAGLESTPEELNALHAEEGDVDGIIFTPDTPCDEVIEDEYYNVKSKSFGLIKDNYYTFKHKRKGKIIYSDTVQAYELSVDDIGMSGVISLESNDWYFFDNVNMSSTGTPIAGGHMWSSFPEDVDEIIIEGVITSGKLTHPGMVYNTIPLEHIPQITTDKLPKSIEDIFDPRIEENEEFHSPYNYYEEGPKFYLSPANGDYRIYKRKIGLKVGNTYNYEIYTITGDLTYPTTSTGTCVCQLIDLWGAEYPALFINEGDDSPAVIDGVNYNDLSDFYKDDTYCLSCKYTSDTATMAQIRLTGEDIDGNPLTTKELYIRPVIETDIIGSASTLHGLTLTVEEINKIPVNSVGRKGTGDSAETFNNSNYASGDYSHAEGNSTHAAGNYSHSEGKNTTASGFGAHAEGYKTTASGYGAHADGSETTASGDYSHAEGHRTTAKGQGSHAEGYSSNQATGTTEDEIRSAWGGSKFSCALGQASHVEGINSLALGKYSHAEGLWSIAKSDSAHAEGYYSTANGKGAHAEGVGTNVVPSSLLSDDATVADIKRSWDNAKFNYAKGEAAHTEGYNCLALGTAAHAEGYRTHSLADYTHAQGYNTIASGKCSHAEGYDSEATGDYTHAQGYFALAIGAYSSADGNHAHAYGDFSSTKGSNAQATRSHAHAIGLYTTANAEGAIAVGKYNKFLDDSGYTYTQQGDGFVVGNGTGAANGDRSNALRVTFSGEVYGLSEFNSSGADYAEFVYPWFDDNADNEDRVGYFVTFKDGKLHKATSKDIVLGVISGNPSVVGNADEDYYWRYERDEFSRIIFEDVEEEVQKKDENGNLLFDDDHKPIMEKTGNIIKNGRMKLSEDYDPSLQSSYVERKNRKEWDYVGMLGILPTRDDGTCIPGQYCKCNDEGIATLATPEDVATNRFTFIVLERVNDNVVKIKI